MKSLYKYIEEAIERVGTLPFTLEEFDELCECVCEGDYDEGDIWKVLWPIVIEKYGEDIWWCLIGYIEGSYNGKNAHKLYSDLKRMPIPRLKRLLGAGSYGAALNIGDDKVLKWFHTRINKTDKKFYAWCMKNEHPYFPRVYKVTPKYVIMEKLETNTDKCKEYGSFIEKRTLDEAMWEVIKKFVKGKEKQPKLTAKEKEIWDWQVEVCKVISKLNIDYPADMFPRNLGIRPSTGDVVWFDV